MVRAGTGDSGTIRAAGSLAGSLTGTMIDTGTMQSQLGTMVINSDDEDDEDAGTMKSKTLSVVVVVSSHNIIDESSTNVHVDRCSAQICVVMSESSR